jgi:5-methylcytosine-specific restriction endonuclease McrA
MAGNKDGAIKSAALRIGIPEVSYREMVASGQKYCWRCRLWKPHAGFGIDRSRIDGRASACKACRKPPKQRALILENQNDYARRRYATDPGYRAERRQHAHARKRGVAPLPVEGIEALTEAFEGRCAYCPAVATTWDHLVPVSKGGRTVPGNMVPACASCNSRKRDFDVFEFMERHGIELTPALDAVMALGFEWGCLQ